MKRTFHQFIIACGGELEKHWNADLGDEVLEGEGWEEEVQCKCVSCNIFNCNMTKVGGGRGDDEHLSNERKPAPRATWLYLLPLPPILTPPWVYSAWFACLASFCLILCNSIMTWKGPEHRAVSLSTSPQPSILYGYLSPRDLLVLQAVGFFRKYLSLFFYFSCYQKRSQSLAS